MRFFWIWMPFMKLANEVQGLEFDPSCLKVCWETWRCHWHLFVVFFLGSVTSNTDDFTSHIRVWPDDLLRKITIQVLHSQWVQWTSLNFHHTGKKNKKNILQPRSSTFGLATLFQKLHISFWMMEMRPKIADDREVLHVKGPSERKRTVDHSELDSKVFGGDESMLNHLHFWNDMELSFSCCYRLFNLAFLSLPWKLFKIRNTAEGRLETLTWKKSKK